MIAQRESIVREALQLPEQERALIIQDLLNSMSPESLELLDSAFAEELDRRFADYGPDPSSSTSWSDSKPPR